MIKFLSVKKKKMLFFLKLTIKLNKMRQNNLHHLIHIMMNLKNMNQKNII